VLPLLLLLLLLLLLVCRPLRRLHLHLRQRRALVSQRARPPRRGRGAGAAGQPPSRVLPLLPLLLRAPLAAQRCPLPPGPVVCGGATAEGACVAPQRAAGQGRCRAQGVEDARAGVALPLQPTADTAHTPAGTRGAAAPPATQPWPWQQPPPAAASSQPETCVYVCVCVPGGSVGCSGCVMVLARGMPCASPAALTLTRFLCQCTHVCARRAHT
jgi:hypothetical protein